MRLAQILVTIEQDDSINIEEKLLLSNKVTRILQNRFFQVFAEEELTQEKEAAIETQKNRLVAAADNLVALAILTPSNKPEVNLPAIKIFKKRLDGIHLDIEKNPTFTNYEKGKLHPMVNEKMHQILAAKGLLNKAEPKSERKVPEITPPPKVNPELVRPVEIQKPALEQFEAVAKDLLAFDLTPQALWQSMENYLKTEVKNKRLKPLHETKPNITCAKLEIKPIPNSEFMGCDFNLKFFSNKGAEMAKKISLTFRHFINSDKKTVYSPRWYLH